MFRRLTAPEFGVLQYLLETEIFEFRPPSSTHFRVKLLRHTSYYLEIIHTDFYIKKFVKIVQPL